MAPIVRGRKGEHVKVLERAKRSGYVRVRVDGNLYELSEEIKLDKNIKHTIEIVVDRLIVREGIEKRLTDSVENALNLADGLLVVDTGDGNAMNFRAGEDERVARDYILTNESSCVVNIVDASNLERNLYLTSQLIEMRVPMIVVVNMLDIAEAHHLKINLEALQEFLKCPVIGMVAARNKGVEELKGAISDFLKKPFVPPMTVKFDEKITHCAHAVEDQLAKLGVERPNWFAVQLMENAPGIADKLPAGAVDAVKPIVEPLNKEFDGDLDIAIADAR